MPPFRRVSLTSLDCHDTIIGPATGAVGGVEALLRLSGPTSGAVTAAVFEPVAPFDAHRPSTRSGRFTIAAWSRFVAGTVTLWPTDRSSTGQPQAEWRLLANGPLTATLMEQAMTHGVRLARPGEFTLRMFLAGRLDLLQAEAVLGLVEARRIEELTDVIDQKTGGLSQPIHQIRSDLLDLLAELEAGLDFVEDDVPMISTADCVVRLRQAIDVIEQLCHRLTDRRVENDQPQVVLIGPANAGKSSLFNWLVGEERSISHPQPGATTDVVSADWSTSAGVVRLHDTAGLMEGVATAGAAQRQVLLAEADLLLACVSPADHHDETWLQSLPTMPEKLIVSTKSDLCPTPAVGSVAISVHANQGRQDLTSAVSQRLRSRPSISANLTSRCQSALAQTAATLHDAIDLIASDAGAEIIAVGIREALAQLGEIIGQTPSDQLLDRIFSKFCIGK